MYDAVRLVKACDALNMAYSAMQQNDAGEFLTLLGDHLEEALKGTRQAQLLLQEFGGELLQQVLYEVDGVRKVSERKEAFLQIELPVKGHPSIMRAFDMLLEGERLEGENAYQLDDTVDSGGNKVPGRKVDAQKRICLGKLPSTLILQLKRFELDYETMANIKLNTECAFPGVLDLGPYTKHALEAQAQVQGTQAEAAGSTVGSRAAGGVEDVTVYDLVGVVVHLGTSNFGHYFSYIRAREAPQGWMTFNDRVVMPFDASEIAEQCFGGQRKLHGGSGGSGGDSSSSGGGSGAGAGACGGGAGTSTNQSSAEKQQSGFLLFYKQREPAKKPASRHQRSGSAPPVAPLRHSRASHKGERDPTPVYLAPGCVPAAAAAGVGGGSGSGSSGGGGSSRAAERPSSSSSRSTKLELLGQALASSAADAAMQKAALEAARLATTQSVHEANSHLLLRQHLYDATYMDFMLQLLRCLPGQISAELPAAPPVVAATPADPPTEMHPLDVAPLLAQFENVASSEAATAVQMQVQVCARFFFEHLIRLKTSLQEPHLAAWTSALETATHALLPAAVWLLHALLALPPPPVEAKPAPPRWLLGALFECRCAAAHKAVTTLVIALVANVLQAELHAAHAAGGPAAVYAAMGEGGGHVGCFLRLLLRHGLGRAATHPTDAPPFLVLLRQLVQLPPPVGRWVAAHMSHHGALLALPAFLIGDSIGAEQLSATLAPYAFARPQQPGCVSLAEASGEEPEALLEVLIKLVEAHEDQALPTTACEVLVSAPFVRAAVACCGEESTADALGRMLGRACSDEVPLRRVVAELLQGLREEPEPSAQAPSSPPLITYRLIFRRPLLDSARRCSPRPFIDPPNSPLLVAARLYSPLPPPPPALSLA